MGKHRNPEVYSGLYHDSEPHRSNLQLAGICGNQKRRVSVSLEPFDFLVLVSKCILCSYSMQYSGQSALQIAVLVAFTQLIPEHQVQVLGVLRARVKVGPLPACSNPYKLNVVQTLPMVYLTFSTVMTIIGFQCPFILIQFGWFVSWTYLRFYKKNAVDLAGGGISYGDRSETFSFVNWFPPLLQYVSS